MNTKQFIFYIMLGVIFVGSGFLCGYTISNIYIDKHPTPITQSSLPQQISDTSTPSPLPSTPPPATPYIPPTPTIATIKPYYLIQNHNDSLNIYEIVDNQKTPIKSFPININILPATDKSLLSDGIVADNLDKAYEIAENFTS